MVCGGNSSRTSFERGRLSRVEYSRLFQLTLRCSCCLQRQNVVLGARRGGALLRESVPRRTIRDELGEDVDSVHSKTEKDLLEIARKFCTGQSRSRKVFTNRQDAVAAIVGDVQKYTEVVRSYSNARIIPSRWGGQRRGAASVESTSLAAIPTSKRWCW